MVLPFRCQRCDSALTLSMSPLFILQASGNQVVFAGEEVDITISTSGSTNECTILDTVRAYDTGGELLGAGFFTIEIHVSQVVYTVSEQLLTLDTVTALVENGYNVGRGGRVKFRTILQESDASGNVFFDNELDVNVLDELGPSMAAPAAPTAAPTTTTATEAPTQELTVSPTITPTALPSVSPTQEPSLAPSQVPSASPSASPSTPSPSSEPSEAPSASPTNFQAGVVPTLSNPQPSSEPSSAPSVVGAAAAASSKKTPPYVIAAIVLGSWAVLMACCFSIFLFRKNQKENDEQRLLSNGRPSEESTPPLRDANRHPEQSSEQSSEFSTLPIIPDVVLADDDHRSLANTTLGEQTAGRKPPKKKRLIDTGVSMNSFEDESLYTSPIGIIPRIQPGRRIDEDDDDKEKKRQSVCSPPTLGVSSAFESDIFFPDTGSSSQESWSMPQSPVASKIGDLVAAELGPVAGDDPEALPSEQGSQYTESRDDVDGMNVVSPWPTQQLSPRSSQSSLHPSLHSSETLKAQNVAATIALTTPPKINAEEHPTVDAPGTYERSGSSSLLIRKKLDDDKSEKEPSKTPMQLLETHKEESPSALHQEQSPMKMLEDEDNKTDVSPIDLQDSDSAQELRQSSSGERPPRMKTHPWPTGKSPCTPTETPPEGTSGRRTVSPYKMRYLEGLQSPTTQRELEQTSSSGSQRTPSPSAKNTSPEPVVLPEQSPTPQHVTPPSEMLPAMYDVKQGDNARKIAFESPPPAPLTEGDVSVLTTSSSGTSVDDNPWLFDSVAQCLGPRSTSADMESLSGKSNKSTKSTRSGKSWRSQRSARSLGSRHARKRRKGSSVGSRGSQRSSFSFGSPGEYKGSSSEFSLAPRSLENDLRRLEQQLASLKSMDPKTQPQRVPPSPPGMTGASNSVTASSMSSSRKVSSKQKIIVVAPSGKLGVILANRHNGTGTVVSEIRGSSPLRGALFPGDKLCK